MNRTPSNYLHVLIKSLTPAEKRHFKIYAKRHTENTNYVRLFNALAQQDVYDEALVMKKFKKEAFLNNFSITKARLYGSILESLTIYHSSSSIASKLRQAIHSAVILYDKSLFDQCEKVLASAKKIALFHEEHLALLEISDLKKRLVVQASYQKKSVNELKEILEGDHHILEQKKTFSTFWNIKGHLFLLLYNQGNARTTDELKIFKRIADNTLKRTKIEGLSVRTKYLFNEIYSAYYFSINDLENSLKYTKLNIELIEDNKSFFAESPGCLALYVNAIHVSSQLKKFDSALFYLKRLQHAPAFFGFSKNQSFEIKYFTSTFTTPILYNKLGDFEKSMEYIPQAEEGLARYSGKIDKILEAYCFIAIAVGCFGAKNIQLALYWNNKILNDKGFKKYQEIYCNAKLLDLVFRIEFDDEGMIQYAYKSANWFISKRKRIYKFENILLHFIERIIKEKNQELKHKDYQLLYTELQQLKKEPLEQTAFDFFDFVSWAQSKAENRSFKEVVVEKAGRKK